MSDVPFEPDQDALPEDVAGPDSDDHRPPPRKPDVDWRVIAIIAVAVLFLLAIYVNKKYYRSKDRAQTPDGAPTDVGLEPPPDAEGSSEPPPSLAEQYANFITKREVEVTETLFLVGDRPYLIGRPPMPIRSREDPSKIIGLDPGRLFDVSERVEGVTPQMLHRRGLPGRREIAFMDLFPPLGLSEGVSMVFKPAEDVTLTEVSDTEQVIGVRIGDEARAYPIKFANYHEVINDNLGGVPILVAWSALADAATAMERTLPDGKVAEFGAAWLMYQGGIVLYDAETQSLWSSLDRRCIVGGRADARLKPVQAAVMPWQAWRSRNPASTALVGIEPVLRIDYERNPARPSDYLNNPTVPYPVYGFDVSSTPMPLKARVFGVTAHDDKAKKAYEANLSRETDASGFEDTLGGQTVRLRYDPEANLLLATDAEGNVLLTEAMIWVCWSGLHPETEVWQEEELRAALKPTTPPTAIPLAEPPPE